MNLIQTTLLSLLPSKRKNTPSGWISFNSVCCTHRGESVDQRQRGGLLLNSDGGFQYHCFNCQFKSGWSPGHVLSKNAKDLFRWLGLSEDELSKINFELLKLKNHNDLINIKLTSVLEEKQLPELSNSLKNWLNSELDFDKKNSLNKIIDYVYFRGLMLDWYDWYWCPEPGYQDRLLIPFFHNQKIVGWTARKISSGNPKYLTVSQPGYVFNLDNQTKDKKFTIVVEGQIDAIAIDGVAIMHNDPSQTQCDKINDLRKEIILVPDRDKAGAKSIQAALNNGWSVSLPPWETHIKDVADAVKNYGRLYTLYTILHYKESNVLKIELMKKKLKTYE